MKSNIIKIIALTFVIVAGYPLQNAQADDFTVCAQVIPCDENGALLREFNDLNSPCYEQYKSACESLSTNVLVEKFRVCEDNAQKYQERIKYLERQLNRKSRSMKRRP